MSREPAAPPVRIEQRPGRRAAGGAARWPEATPAAEGLDAAALETAAEGAAEHDAHSLLVLRNGHLVLERYWRGRTAGDLQQTYSGTKSLFSLLVGRAIERGYLAGLDQPVLTLVPEMPGAQAQLTFRNVMAMQSGMESSMRIEALGLTGRSQLEIALEREIVAAPSSATTTTTPPIACCSPRSNAPSPRPRGATGHLPPVRGRRPGRGGHPEPADGRRAHGPRGRSIDLRPRQPPRPAAAGSSRSRGLTGRTSARTSA